MYEGVNNTEFLQSVFKNRVLKLASCLCLIIQYLKLKF